MTGQDHYTAAENLLERADAVCGNARSGDPYPYHAFLVAQAQVHATLALASAQSAGQGIRYGSGGA